MPFYFSSPGYLSHLKTRKNRVSPVSRASPAHMNSPLEVGYFSPRLLIPLFFCSTIKRSDCLKTTKFQNILRMIYFDIVVNLKDHPTGIIHASLHRLLV